MPALRNVRRSCTQRLAVDPQMTRTHGARRIFSPESETSAECSSQSSDTAPPSPDPVVDEESAPHFVRRSSHARKRQSGHIPRPPNAFMLFRSELWTKMKEAASVERDHRNISRIAAMRWAALSEREKGHFRKLAELEKMRHQERYPDYKYSPNTRKKAAPAKKRTRQANPAEVQRCSDIASLMSSVEFSKLDVELVKLKQEKDAGEDIKPAIVQLSHTEKSVSFALPSSGSSRRSRAAALAVPQIKIEEVDSPDVSINSQSVDDSTPETPDFVPTRDIPPLDLAAPLVSDHFVPEIVSDSTTLVDLPPSLINEMTLGKLRPHARMHADDFLFDLQLVYPDLSSWYGMGGYSTPGFNQDPNAACFNMQVPLGSFNMPKQPELWRGGLSAHYGVAPELYTQPHLEPPECDGWDRLLHDAALPVALRGFSVDGALPSPSSNSSTSTDDGAGALGALQNLTLEYPDYGEGMVQTEDICYGDWLIADSC